MKKAQRVAIIIINWNGFHDTIECLKSLKDLDYTNYQIILVDNASDNDEGDRIKEKFPEIHLIKNDVNEGFTGGNNVGIKWARQNNINYAWILNNDTVVEKESLKYQILHFEDDKTGAVGSKIKKYNTNLIWSKGIYLLKISFTSKPIKFFSNINEGKKDILSESEQELKYVSGCSILLRTDMENIFFDEAYFAYCEDMDLCYRIRKDGYKLIYEPRSIVYHKNAQSTGGKKFNRHSLYYSYRNKLFFLRKFYPCYILCLISPIYCVCFFRDLIRAVIFYDNKRVLLKAMVYGILDGLKADLGNKNGSGFVPTFF